MFVGVALTIASLICFLGLVKGMDRGHLLNADQWVGGHAWGGGVVAISAAWPVLFGIPGLLRTIFSLYPC